VRAAAAQYAKDARLALMNSEGQLVEHWPTLGHLAKLHKFGRLMKDARDIEEEALTIRARERDARAEARRERDQQAAKAREEKAKRAKAKAMPSESGVRGLAQKLVDLAS
jgi:hypothetical protein